MKNATVNNCILCEEIRQEKNNKLILLGVYAKDILVSNIPATIPLAPYIEITIHKPEQTTISVRISGPGEGEAIMRVLFDTKKRDDEVVILSPRFEVHIACEGMLNVDISDDEKNWQPVLRRHVIQQDGLWSLNPPIVPQPLSEQSESDGQPKET